MSRKTPKTAVVAFKVEEELAEFLNKLPNKSAFIRKAIAAQMSMACPLCNGIGTVSRGVHDHYAPLLTRFNSRSCEGCGHEMHVPLDPGELDDETRTRLEQFLDLAALIGRQNHDARGKELQAIPLGGIVAGRDLDPSGCLQTVYGETTGGRRYNAQIDHLATGCE